MIKINYRYKTIKWTLWEKIKERFKKRGKNKHSVPILGDYYTMGYYSYAIKSAIILLGSTKKIIFNRSDSLINEIIDTIIHESLHGVFHNIKISGKGNEEWIIDKLRSG